MAGLFESLSAASRALLTQTSGLETVGQNIANVNTPGYTRRTIDLAEVPPAETYSAGGGVTVHAIQSNRDRFAERRLWSEQPLAQQQSATADLLGGVQSVVGLPGSSLDASLSAFFDSFADLAQDPTSGVARQSVVLQGQSLSSAFAQMSTSLIGVQHDADIRVQAAVQDISQLASQIATYNAEFANVGGSDSPQGLVVLDQLRKAVSDLSGIVNINVTEDNSGQLNVSYANGKALVVGVTTFAPTTAATGTNGAANVIAADGTDVTSLLTGGRIAGLINVRDSVIPGYQTQLDTLAYTVVQRVNALHSAGYDLNGAAGGNFFTPIAGAAGSARLMSVSAAIAADYSKIAAAGAASPGDNQNARAIANLSDTPVLAGNTATLAQGWSNLVYQVGIDSQNARQQSDTHTSIVNQINALIDSTSGVSLDEEATTMLKFQHAYTANARFFTVIDSALQTLLGMVQG